MATEEFVVHGIVVDQEAAEKEKTIVQKVADVTEKKRRKIPVAAEEFV